MAALHQTTLVLAKTTTLQWAPKLTHHHSLLLPLNFRPSKHTHHFPRKTLTCSNQYNNYNSSSNNDNINSGQYYEYERHAVTADKTQFPRPTEIEWRKEICNSVQLIGNVGTPVQIKHLSSGKVVAWSRLAVRKSPTDTAWINLTFWDDLAQIAYQHVEKGQQIYVSGRLVSDTVESDDGKQQTYYKVVVSQLNFIERSASPVALYDGDSNSAGKRPKNYAASNTGSVEELWQAFFVNPTEWWDNRKNKRSPNYPDFKHKDTGEALWVEGRNNPPWVKSQLSILDTRMESYPERNTGVSNFIVGDDFSPF
ncbi:protein OSB1, mitochondrial-like isoform X1 [Apium graveolens]|uniref:protein OSB1, mitochondrial-like isoform X1 n=1 Tax=Apium graveolens TaxID=4045 RepID=UPI003D7B699C